MNVTESMQTKNETKPKDSLFTWCKDIWEQIQEQEVK